MLKHDGLTSDSVEVDIQGSDFLNESDTASRLPIYLRQACDQVVYLSPSGLKYLLAFDSG